MKFLANILAKAGLIVDGTTQLNTIANATIDTDRFLVSDGGVVKYRTGAQLLSDIGPITTSTLKHQVKLGENIAKGQAVYVSSADGTNMIVSKASNTSEATSSKTLGLIETGGVTNAQVSVITEGLLAGLDTSTAVAGDPVWLGTNGNLIFGLVNKPYAPAHLVFIGIVTRVQQNNGEIFVKVQNGFELQEIHNVSALNPTNNDGIFYNSSTQLWEKKSIPTVLGYTPANAARVLTINGVSYDLTADRTWSVGTVTSVAALTLGTTGTDLSSSVANGTTTPVITLNVPTASATNRGALSSTDWTTFNNKQNAITLTTTGTSGAATLVGSTLNIPQYQSVLTNPITGTGTSGQVSYFNGTNSITSSSNFVWDNANGRLGVGGSPGAFTLDVNGTARATTSVSAGTTVLAGFGQATRSEDGVTNNNYFSTAQDIIFSSNRFRSNFLSPSNRLVLSTQNIANRTVALLFGIDAVQLDAGITLDNNTRTVSLINSTGNTNSSTYTPRLNVFTSGNVAINSLTDAGFRLDVNGTARVQGATTISGSVNSTATNQYFNTWQGTQNVSGIAAFGTTVHTYFNPTISSSSTNLRPVALSVVPTFSGTIDTKVAVFASTSGSAAVTLGANAAFLASSSETNAVGLLSSVSGTNSSGVMISSTPTIGLNITSNPTIAIRINSVSTTGAFTPFETIQLLSGTPTASRYIVRNTTASNSTVISTFDFINSSTSSTGGALGNNAGIQLRLGISNPTFQERYTSIAAIAPNQTSLPDVVDLRFQVSNASGTTTNALYLSSQGHTLTTFDNTTGLTISGSSLTGSNAQSLVSLSQTWNTTGNPTAFLLNITNTASGATADLMDLQVGGASRFEITAAGRARLGAYGSGTITGTATYNLAVDASGNVIEVTGGGGGGGIGGSGTTNYVPKFTASTTLGNSQIFDDGTNVGIGTATPSQKLEVSGSGNIAIRVVSSNNFPLFQLRDNRTPHEWNIENGRIAGALGFYYATGNATRMLITSAGNVGIQTTTIGSALQVNGNAAIGYSASTAAPTNGLAVAGNTGIGTTNITTRFAIATTNARIEIDESGTNPYLEALNAARTTSLVYSQYARGHNLFVRTGGSGSFIQAFTLADNGTLLLGNGETAGTPTLGIISGTGGTGTNVAGAEFRIRGGASTGSGAGGPITFYTSAAGSAGTTVNAATERARFTTAGNLGIGTNTSAWGSVFRVLELGNGGSIYNWTGGNLGNVTIASNSYEDASLVQRYINTNGASAYLQNNGEHRWSYAASGTAGAAITYIVGMNLNNSGNLGLGTTTIGSRLQVNGGAAIGYSASTAAPTNGLIVAGNAYFGGQIASLTDVMQLKGTGNVLIAMQSTVNTQFSGMNLYNEAGTLAASFALGNSNTGSFSNNFFLGPRTASGNLLFVTGASGTTRMTMTTNGELQFTPATNTSVLSTTGAYSLTGANAQSLIDLAGTWNTTGNPTAIKLNITNTASGANSLLMDLQVGGTPEFRVTRTGNVVVNGSTSTYQMHVVGTGSLLALGEESFTTGRQMLFGIDGSGNGEIQSVQQGTSYRNLSINPLGGNVGIATSSPTSTLHANGSVAKAITTKTATYTLTSSDHTVIFNLNGNATANLPDATTCTGRIYMIKINRTNTTDTLTIDPNGTQTIDGFTTYALQCQYAVIIQSDGSNWQILGDFANGTNCL